MSWHSALTPNEQRRCRHCKGCKYFSSAGSFGTCDYLLMTDMRRPCKAGKGCTVRKDKAIWQPTEKYLAWVKLVDEQEAYAERKRKLAEEREALQQKYGLPDNLIKTNGRKPSFDIKYAQMLYNAGYYNFEIAEVLGTTAEKVSKYAQRHDWAEQAPRDLVRTRHDIPTAIAEYKKYIQETADNERKRKEPQKEQNRTVKLKTLADISARNCIWSGDDNAVAAEQIKETAKSSDSGVYSRQEVLV